MRYAACVVAAVMGCGRIGFDPGDPAVGGTENGIGCGLRDLAVGAHASCAIDGNGGLWCWGSLATGKVPARVALDGPAVKVRMGHQFACVLLESGRLRCFGQNDYGQLGTGDMLDHETPTAPAGDRTYVDIAALKTSACAVTTAGEIECWGENHAGLATTDQQTPLAVAIAGASDFTRVFAWNRSVCADTATQRFCWGEFPIIEGASYQAPTLVPFMQPTALTHDIGCTLDGGRVSCAGKARGADLGDGMFGFTGFRRSEPLAQGIVAIGAGSRGVCAIGTDGELWCWGDNRAGEIGTGDISIQSTPARVAIPPAGRIALGFAHVCAETTDGVYCWGSNVSGALGRGTSDLELAGTSIAGLPTSIAEVRVRSRQGNGCARTVGGEVWCWGQGGDGITGDASHASAPVASKIQLPFAAIEIGLGVGFACAHDGAQLRCWGHSDNGGLGPTIDSAFQTTPAPIAGLPSGPALSSLTSEGEHGLCVLSGSTPYCWGLQDGASGTDAVPISGAPATSSLAALRPYSTVQDQQCLLDTTGTAWCWGSNEYGELGRDTAGAPSPTPAPVVGGRPYSEIATWTGYTARTCAIPMSGGAEIDCWGSYDSTNFITPTVRPLSGVPQHLEAGGNTLCAILVDGTRDCVGNNYQGQFGDGAGASASVFEHVTSTASALSLSGDNACFVEAGVVRCVGSLRHGALGARPPGATPMRIDLTCK